MTNGADPSPASTLSGVGPVTQGWLEAAGISSVEDLRALGAVEAYRRIKFMRLREVNLNALYALEAALRGCHWQHLPADVKAVLQREAKIIDLALRKTAVSRCTPE